MSVKSVFKRFNRFSIAHTWASSLLLRLGLKRLKFKKKFVILTFSIDSDIAQVWQHFVLKYFGKQFDVLLVDCAGDFPKSLFPQVRLVRYLNYYHAKKIDHFRKMLRAPYLYLMDDDVFPISSRLLPAIQNFFKKPRTAVFSLKPRTWWQFRIGGKKYWPMGSYSLVIHNPLFQKLNLNFGDGLKADNPYTTRFKYDTGDYAHEYFLKNGYRVEGLSGAQVQKNFVCCDGLGHASVLTRVFKTAAEYEKFFGVLASEKRWTQLEYFLKGLWGLWMIQDIYRSIFDQEPRRVLALEQDFFDASLKLFADQKISKNLKAYFADVRRQTQRLRQYA